MIRSREDAFMICFKELKYSLECLSKEELQISGSADPSFPLPHFLFSPSRLPFSLCFISQFPSHLSCGKHLQAEQDSMRNSGLS